MRGPSSSLSEEQVPWPPCVARAPAQAFSTSRLTCLVRARSLARRPSIKLSSNETPFGPSPRAIEAYHAAAARAVALPRRLRPALREAIAKLYGLDRGAHRLRRGLRRAAQPAGLRLSRPRRRGDLQRARFPSSSTRSPSWRAAPRRSRARAEPHRRCRCHPRLRQPRRASSSSPIRTIRPAPTSRSTR